MRICGKRSSLPRPFGEILAFAGLIVNGCLFLEARGSISFKEHFVLINNLTLNIRFKQIFPYL